MLFIRVFMCEGEGSDRATDHGDDQDGVYEETGENLNVF